MHSMKPWASSGVRSDGLPAAADGGDVRGGGDGRGGAGTGVADGPAG